MSANLLRGLWLLGALASAGVALFSYRFLGPDPFMGSDIARNLMRHPWLTVHAGLAATALLLGPLQFLPRLRARRPGLHRALGRVYGFCCLAGAVAGLLLAYGTDAGPIAQSGFGALAVLWFAATAWALRLAVTRRITLHQRWMVRSFALTFAAVTLRLYLPVAPLLGFSFLEGYRFIAWFCWVSNLLVAEIWLNRTWIAARLRRDPGATPA